MSNEASRRVRLTCPTCHELLEFEAGELPRREPCAFCGREIHIPSRAHLAAITPTTRLRSPDEIGDYQIAPPAEPEAAYRPAALTAPAERRASPGFNTSLACPHCGQSVGTRLEDRPKRVSCPHCGGDLFVPANPRGRGPVEEVTGSPPPGSVPSPPAVNDAADAPPANPPPKVADPPPDQVRPVFGTRKTRPRTERPAAPSSPTPSPPAETPPRVPRRTVFDQMAVVRTESLPTPPEWTFFSGVFSFPFQQHSLSRWLYQVVGFTVLLLVVATIAAVSAQYGAGRFGMVLAFFVLPMIWIGIWSFSFASANFLCIVEGTAAGANEIREWPEPSWRDWVPKLVYLGWIASIPLVLASALAGLVPEEGPPRVLVAAGLFCVIYPICLMSALEANSPFAMFTWPIVRSLYRNPGDWLSFFGVTLLVTLPLVMIPAAWLTARLGDWSPYLMAVVMGPLAATTLFVVARLFGRLAWKISGIDRKWARRRRLSIPDDRQRTWPG